MSITFYQYDELSEDILAKSKEFIENNLNFNFFINFIILFNFLLSLLIYLIIIIIIIIFIKTV